MLYNIKVLLIVVVDLGELRRAIGITQVQLADALGTTQGQVSRLEKQNDMLLSTLIAYLIALGVDAKLVVSAGRMIIEHELTVAPR